MRVETIKINTPFIKLDALLKFSAVASTGGHAKEMILSGDVMVESERCIQRGKKIYPGMAVVVKDEGETIKLEVGAVED